MKPESTYLLLASCAGLFAVIRPFVPSVTPNFGFTGWYKALAHIMVGILFGFALGTREWGPVIVAGMLTAVEVAVFVFGKSKQ